MSRRAARAPLRLHELAAPLGLITLLGGGALLLGTIWLAAAAAAGGAPPFGSPMIRALIDATSTGTLDPVLGRAGPRWVFWLVLIAQWIPLGAAMLWGWWWAADRAARLGSPEAALAGRRDYTDMHGRGAARRALQLRPSLSGGPIASNDLGLRLGRLGNRELYASEEDVLLAIAGPRSNKTSAMVVPAILTAPGPVIATSNKIDAYTLTAWPRAQLGRVFVLDPQRIAGTPQDWWWNPLTGIHGVGEAEQLVRHFVATVGGESDRADPYFTPAAGRLLTQLVLAAAVGHRDLRDVSSWLATQSDDPVGILQAAGHHRVAQGLTGLLETPDEQRGGVYETALTALRCLESEPVVRYVTPPTSWSEPPPDPDAVTVFDPWRFFAGYQSDRDGQTRCSDTLWALSREGAGTAAPVVAALVDCLLRTAAEAATASGGRIDPPVRAVLDEAANICPIRNLPDLYSYFGSMSIQVLTFLQSEPQGVALWGKAGMDKLWSASTVKLIGAAVHSDEFCERVSRLVGEHDVPTWSDQRGRGGGSSTMSTRRDRILSVADVAALTKTEAVLLCSGRRGGKIELLPWYREPESGDLSRYAAQAVAEVRLAAIAQLGPDNPLARRLAAGATHR